jgi:thiamine pyrophosphate-dependent acetolactate synthase large subunit-like protein
MLAGRASRRLDAWHARVAIAEAVGAKVITDMKIGAAFPTDHPLHVGTPGMLLPDADGLAALAAADVILALDWVDLGGALKAAKTEAKTEAYVISATLDHHIHNGWSMDHQAFAPVDMLISADPDAVALALAGELGPPAKPAALPAPRRAMTKPSGDKLTVEHLAFYVREAVGQRDVSLTHLPLSWNGSWWPFRHPLDYLGSDGGGGIGGGPGISVGAALALKGTGRLPVAICGDGDYLMGVTALWTATHYRIPLLLVVANNRSFFNDELHQERVARMRSRPVENRWIGQRISDPDIDLATMARAQGGQGFGPVSSDAELAAALKSAIAAADGGDVAVVDVRVEPGYAPAMTAALTRKAD